MGILKHFCPMCGPLPTSKEEVLHGISCLSICTLIGLLDVGSIEISIQSSHAGLDQHSRNMEFCGKLSAQMNKSLIAKPHAALRNPATVSHLQVLHIEEGDARWQSDRQTGRDRLGNVHSATFCNNGTAGDIKERA
jgi:hypothetical protein